MSEPFVLLGLGALLVIGGVAWLRQQQRRFIEELRRAGDPLADAPGSKTFRQRFQARLFGMEGARPLGGVARTLLTLLMLVALGAIVVYSLLQFVTGGAA